jgi:hypothetical protein
MTEQPPVSAASENTDPSTWSEPLDEPAHGEPTWTGVPAVDQVLRDVDDLDAVPLEEHLGRFERAHETLRSALDAEPDELREPIEPGDPA